MKALLAVLLITISASAQNKLSRIAPACGPSDVTFETQDQPAKTPLLQPDPKKVQVFFIQDNGVHSDRQHYIIKIGLDGDWVGAYKRNSYFVVSIEPGEHHICANVQSKSSFGQNVELAHFVAEPGKIYYFRTRFAAGLTTMYPIYPNLELNEPDSDQAKYLIERYPRIATHRK